MLEDVGAGVPRFVVVTGEPGIGKTRLLDELADGARRREFLELRGSAAEFERELPFAVAIDALDAHLEALGPKSFDRLAADGLDELGRVFPSLRDLATESTPPATAAERFRAYDAVRELIERLAARRPVLLALDDLHWGDGASLELAASLVRRPPQAAVLVALSYRSGRTEPGFESTIHRAAQAGALERIELGPLGREECEQLAAQAQAAERLRLSEESGGNPFYLLQLSRHGAEPEPEGAAGSPEQGGVPSQIAASIGAELAALPDDVRAFAEAAAVAGDPFEIDLALAAADTPEDDALRALDLLASQQLVRSARIPRHFAFRHPLVRRAIYQSSSPGSRLETHRRLAAALAERGAPAPRRAHHVEQSARHGDEDAIATLREAGLASAERAPASAARWFAGALRLLPEDSPPGERLGLLGAEAKALAATGRFEEAYSSLRAALDLLPANAGVERVELIDACADMERLLGRPEEAHARRRAALDALADRRSPEAVALMIGAAVDALHDADYQGIAPPAEQALEIARQSGFRPLAAVAAALVTVGHAGAGDVRQALAGQAEAAELVDSMPDEELASRLDATAYLAGAEFWIGLYEAGIAHAERGIRLARSTGQGELLPALIPALGSLLNTRGELARSAEVLDQAVEAARLSRNGQALAWATFTRSHTARLAGDLDLALERARESVELAAGRRDRLMSMGAGMYLAEALHELGDPAGAAEQYRASSGGEGWPRTPVPIRPWNLERLTRIYLELGERDKAQEAIREVREIAEHSGASLALAMADRATAALAHFDCQPGSASEHALSAAAHADACGARIEAALSRILAGRALAELDERERAIEALQAAADELDACGAVRYRAEAEGELGKLGRRPHRRTLRGSVDAGGPESLSGRELEVARLVAERRTNREVGAELFISVKTVETHLRNIFQKLGVNSRAEVADALEVGEGAASDALRD